MLQRTRPGAHLALLAAAALSCAPAGSAGGEAAAGADPSPWIQTAWAVRVDTVPDPSDAAGVIPGADTSASGPVTVDADQPFRLRFELEWPEAGAIGGAGGEPRFQLQVRRNGGEWEELLARDFPYPDEISTPRVSIIDATTWEHGALTDDLLDGSAAPFVGGSAVALDSVTAAGSIETGASGPAQTEWEWPVVIRLYADAAVSNAAGDTFEFRMAEAGGQPATVAEEGDAVAMVRLRVPERLLGGTFVETPGVLGPWQAEDGALYFPMEPAETFNVLMTVKSGDFGDTWMEVDGANRPLTDDLEGFATAAHGGLVYMLHQVSEATYLHAFATTDAPSAVDTWVIRDELVAEHSEPPTQVAALVADPEGRLTAFYGDSSGLRFRTRSSAGQWGSEMRIDGPDGTVASGVMATRGADGRIHVAYTAGNAARRDVWYRALSPSGDLGDPVRVATGVGVTDDDIGAVAPLVHLVDSGLTIIAYRLGDGYLYTRTVRPDGTLTPQARVTDRQVVQNASDSEQVGVDAVGFEGRVILAVIDEETDDLQTIEGRPDADGSMGWEPPRPLVADVNAQWVRGRVMRDADGGPVYGIVYDAGSDGGSGMNRFVIHPLR